MELVSVPSRQWKTWSTWILIAIAALNLAGVVANQLNDSQLIKPETFALVNTILGAVGAFAKFVQQNIAVTTEQKRDLIEAASDSPVKAGEQDVQVTRVVDKPPFVDTR